jgi:hypothetical protein
MKIHLNFLVNYNYRYADLRDTYNYWVKCLNEFIKIGPKVKKMGQNFVMVVKRTVASTPMIFYENHYCPNA